MANCTKCGAPLNPGATFCPNCGAAVQTMAAQPAPPAAAKKMPKTMIIIAVVVVIAVLIIAAVALSGGNTAANNNNNNNDNTSARQASNTHASIKVTAVTVGTRTTAPPLTVSEYLPAAEGKHYVTVTMDFTNKESDTQNLYGPLSFDLETSDGQVVNGAYGPDYVVPDGIQAGKTAQVIVAFEVPDGVTAKTLVYDGLLSDLKVTL